MPLPPFPASRPRRLRRTEPLRRITQENSLTSGDLIFPVFVREGTGIREPIPAMPGQFRYSPDTLLEVASAACDLGIPAIAVFPVIDGAAKSATGAEAYNPDGLVPRVVRQLKQQVTNLAIITDLALDPYTSHGQDGIIDSSGYVLNDATLTALARQALCHADAGADIVAPSDMMDGRVGATRSALDQHGFIHTVILAYAAKYASSFYGPFRDAVGSAAALGQGDKKTYQMHPANANEALREVELDIAEGADMVMVKPGLPYLDIICRVKQTFGVPTLAYHVSGEYSMLKAAAAQGWINEHACMLESLLAFKRAGADAVLTYFALDAARALTNAE